MTVTPLPAPPLPRLRIGPKGTWSLSLHDLWAYRELLVFLAQRDVKIRYRQTLLGAAWVLIQPLLTMLVFTFFFGRLVKIPSHGIPYSVFSYSALLAFSLFSRGVTASGTSLIGSANLITKVYFPRLIIPCAVVLALLLDFAIGAAMLVVLMIGYGLPFLWTMLLIPLPLIVLVLFTLSIGIFAAALSVRYRDVAQALPFIVQLAMFASPVIYPSSMIPARFRVLFAFNPLMGVIEGFRSLLFGHVPFPVSQFLLATAVTLVVLVGALYTFRRMERSFADVI